MSCSVNKGSNTILAYSWGNYHDQVRSFLWSCVHHKGLYKHYYGRMTLCSRWKSALVKVIAYDTIHICFSQDPPQGPRGWCRGHPGVSEEERLLKVPWERLGSQFQEPVSKACDHRNRDLLSGRNHQLISKNQLGVDKKGQWHIAWNEPKQR